MRPLVIAAGLLVVFLLGGFVEYALDWPYFWVERMVASNPAASPARAPDANASTAIPRYSNARGAEDAPRDDVAEGAKTDMQRCINTMVMRRESETEARTVCRKIITGIGG